jgi:hypothetical protein
MTSSTAISSPNVEPQELSKCEPEKRIHGRADLKAKQSEFAV